MPTRATAPANGPASVPHSTLPRPFATRHDAAAPGFPHHPTGAKRCGVVAVQDRDSGYYQPGPDMFQPGYEPDSGHQYMITPRRSLPTAWAWLPNAMSRTRSRSPVRARRSVRLAVLTAPGLTDANVISGGSPAPPPSQPEAASGRCFAGRNYARTAPATPPPGRCPPARMPPPGPPGQPPGPRRTAPAGPTAARPGGLGQPAGTGIQLRAGPRSARRKVGRFPYKRRKTHITRPQLAHFACP